MPSIFVKYKLNEKKKIRRVHISGKVKKWSRGVFVTRFGARVHGVKISYVNATNAGKGHRIKTMRVSKIVPIPDSASDVKVSRKR